MGNGHDMSLGRFACSIAGMDCDVEVHSSILLHIHYKLLLRGQTTLRLVLFPSVSCCDMYGWQ